MTQKSLLEFVNLYLRDFIIRHDFVVEFDGVSGMGEACLCFHNTEFRIKFERDRGGHESISIGSKIRARPRAHLREWSLSHIRGYLDGHKDHYRFPNLEVEARWLEEHENRVLDSVFLNSRDLSAWSVKASHRLFTRKKV